MWFRFQLPLVSALLGWSSFVAAQGLETAFKLPCEYLVTLKTAEKGKFVVAERFGNRPVRANRDKADAWETFRIVKRVCNGAPATPLGEELNNQDPRSV